jgi:hypothetical protein
MNWWNTWNRKMSNLRVFNGVDSFNSPRLHQTCAGSGHRFQLDEIDVAGGNRNWLPGFQHRFQVQFNRFAYIMLRLLQGRAGRDAPARADTTLHRSTARAK